MKNISLAVTLLIGFVVVLPASVSAQDTGVGKREFDANCAVCHGASGKGDGPFAEFIKTKVPDLTALAKGNNGAFPSERVYEVVDGRADVAAHGPRSMPIWGAEYNDDATDYYREVWQVQNAADIVRSRIESLVAYVQSLQQQ